MKNRIDGSDENKVKMDFLNHILEGKGDAFAVWLDNQGLIHLFSSFEGKNERYMLVRAIVEFLSEDSSMRHALLVHTCNLAGDDVESRRTIYDTLKRQGLLPLPQAQPTLPPPTIHSNGRTININFDFGEYFRTPDDYENIDDPS